MQAPPFAQSRPWHRQANLQVWKGSTVKLRRNVFPKPKLTKTANICECHPLHIKLLPQHFDPPKAPGPGESRTVEVTAGRRKISCRCQNSIHVVSVAQDGPSACRLLEHS